MPDLEAQLIEAQVPRPFQIFGFKLRPFSMGHLILFQRFGIDPAKTRFDIEELFIGVTICSMTFEEATEDVWTGNFEKRIKEASRATKKKGFDFEKRQFLFREYLKDGFTFPKFKSNDKGKEVETPWFQSIRLQLMKNLGFTDSQIMNRPLSLCMWDFACMGEIEGFISLNEPDYKELRRMADQFKKEHDAKA